MKKVRQYLATTLIVAMTAGMMSVPSIAAPVEEGSTGPEYKTIQMWKDSSSTSLVDRNVFFANGVPVTITAPAASASNIGATITWDGGSVNVSKNTYVFAGGGLGTKFSEGSIVMKGGRVDSLNGGGYGVTQDNSPAYGTDTTADVGESYIGMQGGTVRQIVGGGYGCSSVDEVTILMEGGKTGVVMGGGFAAVAGISDLNSIEEAKNSRCHVGNVTMTLVGDEVNEYPGVGFNGNGSVFGGGQGNVGVDQVTMNITGKIDLSNSWVIAGGSNGYTGNATVNISGGNLRIIQSLNRGMMDSAQINVTGGTIKDLYAAGDSSDANVKGTIGSVKLNLIKGNITTLHTGSTEIAKHDLPADNNVIAARYGKNATIKNLEAAKTAFGSCLTELLTNVTLDKETLSLAIGDNKQLKATVTGGIASDADLEGIVWSSDKEDVASVSSDGMVTAEAAGTATIKAAYAQDEDIFATCTVTVSQPTLKISSKSASIKVGGELELTAAASPSDAAISWEIEDETILEDITDFGEDSDTFSVKGIGIGETTVTAVLDDYDDVKAVCKVTVKANPNLPIDEQIEGITNGLESALNGGPGGTPPTPEEKTTLADNAVKAVAKLVTPTSIGKLTDLSDVEGIYEKVYGLEDVLCENFAVIDARPDDSNVPIKFVSLTGLLINVDIDAAGGTLPVEDEEMITVTLGLETAELPDGAASQVVTDSAVAVDMKLLQQNGIAGEPQTIQPRVPILLVIDVPEGVDISKPIKVWNYHDGTAKELKSWVDEDLETISFLVDKFGVFVIGNVNETEKPHSTHSGGGGSSNWHPAGTWVQNQLGWKFKNYDGTYAADCWKQLTYNGRVDWYHFDAAAMMQTGWFTDIDGNIYYLNPVSDGFRGAMLTDWQEIEGKYYYFNPVSDGSRGSLYRSRITPNGHTVGADGSRIK